MARKTLSFFGGVGGGVGSGSVVENVDFSGKGELPPPLPFPRPHTVKEQVLMASEALPKHFRSLPRREIGGLPVVEC